MTGPLTARRAAEFDAMISRDPAALTDRDAERFADLLAVVRDLRSIPEISPRPEFVSSLRTRLMIEADTALLPQATRPLTSEEQRLLLPVRANKRDRRLAAVLGGAALVGATSSMALAAQTALPGESLYPVKRALEEIETGFAQGDSAKGRAMLANAEGRLAELDDLARRSDPASVSAVAPTLDTFTQQAQDASASIFAAYEESGDADLVTELRTFVSGSIESLAELESTLPVSAHDDLVAAAQVLAGIDQRAQEVCATCGEGSVSVPSSLLTSAGPIAGVESVLIAASQDRRLTQGARGNSTQGSGSSPEPISGIDVEGIVVPDLTVPNATGGQPSDQAPTGSQGPSGTPGSGQKLDVRTPVNSVTKLLTGDLDSATSVVPGAEQPVGELVGPGGIVDDTVDGVQDTLDDTTEALPTTP